jgi:hypothetical protein
MVGDRLSVRVYSCRIAGLTFYKLVACAQSRRPVCYFMRSNLDALLQITFPPTLASNLKTMQYPIE